MAEWWRNAVIYQIYPASFQDSNNDGVGDIPGIISRLEYLKKLGVDIIWLSPVYKSPQVDNGYDISDYRDINPTFGTMADFDALLEKAHALGLKIVMDLVVNHTSDQHAWFKASASGKDNPYRDYYIWRDGTQEQPPNNWGSFFMGPGWQYDSSTEQCYLHLFAKEQPDLNWENPAVRADVYDMMNWWLDKGVDGFRMDVINYISKPDGLPDAVRSPDASYANPEPLVANGPKIHSWLQEMNHEVLRNRRVVTVGETPGVTTEEAERYASLKGNELSMVFQFEHMALDTSPNPVLGRWAERKASLRDLRANLSKWQTALHGKAWNSLYWNNHDQPRVVSRFGDDSSETTRVLSAKMLATLLHMQQGTPFIYEGEEIGMTNANFTQLSDYVDIDSLNAYQEIVVEQKLLDDATMLRCLAKHSRDNARTPMQWSDAVNAGFSENKTWEKVNPNYRDINVENALNDPNSIFYHYQKLIHLRHTLPVITDGMYQLVEGNEADDQIYAFTRKNADTTLLVLLNYTNDTHTRDYAIPAGAKQIISNYADDEGQTLRPYEAKVYQF